MTTVKEAFCTTIEVNRSKFITHLVPISAYKGLQATLKAQHPKANHVVYAVRHLNAYEQTVENSSDDGEPKGCAGLPTLNVLRGEKLINCAVLTVRYFGGIKLGTGGMARAYAKAVKAVVAEADLIRYEKEVTHTFETSYSEVDRTLYRLKQLGITVYERDFGAVSVAWEIRGSEESVVSFKT